MKKLLFAFCVVAGAVLSSGSAFGIDMPTSVELVSAGRAAAADNEIELAFQFKIAPGWHVYYKEPGESGFPTRINLSLPQELEEADLVWPEPEQFVLPGNKHCNGYSSGFMLKARVRPRAPLSPGQQLNVQADAAWLNCKEEMCVPQKQRFEQVVTW